MLILATAVAVSMPVGHATNNVHTFYLGSSTVGACSGKCEGLTTSAGSDDTTTTQSVVIGSSPTEDVNAGSNTAATWTSGTTISITTFATTSTADTILVFVASSKTTTPIQNAPSATGFTCDASARKEVAISAGVGLSEWVCHTSAAISSETVTVNLSATPTWAIAQIISVNGAEDPTGTFSPFDQNSGCVYSNNRNSGGGTNPPTVTAVSSLNADDLFISASGDTGANTQTAGAIGGTTGTLDISTTSTGALAVEHRSVTATLSASSCNFGTATSRWIIFCDALQSAPKYYVVEPDVGATTLTATPSTSTPSGYAWIYDTSGLAANAIEDIQSGTWQIDQTIGLSSITGAPAARLWVTVWSCTTHSLGTCTFLFKNWDTGTINVAAQTAATKNTYTTASQVSFITPAFLSVEYFLVWQYSGNTAAVTVTHTTVSAKSDIITPGWDTMQPLTASLQTSAVLTRLSNIFKSLSGLLSSVSSFVEKTSIFKAFAASITLTMGNMVANVNSGKLTCNSNPRSCSTTLTATWTMASGFAEKSSLSRSLTGSLSLATSQVKALAKSLTGSLSLASGFAEKSSLFRSLTGSLSLTASQVKGLAKALTGSLSLASGFAEKSSLFRSLTGSLSLTASQVKGLAKALTGSLSLASSFAEKSSLFRSLTGSLSLASSFVEKNILFRSLAGSLGLAGSESKGHTFYYGSTSQTGCTVKCEQLATTTGTADTATSVKVGSSTTCCFEVQPDVGSSTTTVTPSDITPTGQAWVSPTDLGGITIQSGSWEFDTTITATKTGTANMRFLVWSCLTASEGTCTLLFDFTGTANIEATTSATKNIDVSPIEGPFSNVHFLTIEVWISSTVSTGVPSATDTMTTVSGASDVITPAWRYGQNLFATLNAASSFAEKSSLFRSLSGSLSLLGSQVAGRAFILSASLGSSSSLAEKSSLFRSLSGSLSLAASQLKRLAMTFSGSLCSVSSLAEKNSLFRSLSGSLSLSSGFTEKSSLFRSLTGSLSLAASQVKGLARSLTGSLSLSSGFAEKSSLFRSLTGSLSSVSSFAEKSSIFRSLTGSLVLASGFAEKSSLFRSLTGSLSSSSSLAEKSSLFRSLTGSLSVVVSQAKGLARSLSASLSLSSGFT